MVIVDTGPLVALLSADDQWHRWAVEKGRELSTPLYTCEAVLTEAYFLLGRVQNGRRAFSLLLQQRDFLILPWRVADDRQAVSRLLEKYADLPASFADICLVRLAERLDEPLVWTTDRHFSVYRIHGTERIKIVAP